MFYPAVLKWGREGSSSVGQTVNIENTKKFVIQKSQNQDLHI